MYWKRLHISPYEFGMAALVIAACLLRIFLISQHWPVTNSDESVMDIMALHIANKGTTPIFFYGQAYMGPIEAYIGAILYHLFGASVFALRLGVIPFFGLFLICMYFFTRSLYTSRLALLTVALLSLGSNDVVIRQLKAIGGYPEIVFFATFIMLLAYKLANSFYEYRKYPTREARWKRWLLYWVLGFFIGFSIWVDQLIMPFILAASILLLVFNRREILSRASLWALAGILIGASPLIYYNLTHSADQNSLRVLLDLQHAGADEMVAKHIPQARQYVGDFFIALPALTSFNPLCPVSKFPLFGPLTTKALQCTVLQGSWSLGYFILWSWACVLAVFALRKLRQQKRQSARETDWTIQEHQQRVCHSTRLLLLLSAMLTFILFARSPNAALHPDTSARYLVCLLVALPVMLWPLWQGIERAIATRRFQPGLIVNTGFLLLIIGMFVSGMVGILRDFPNARAVYEQQDHLITNLKKVGATHIYTDYWTGYRIAFQSHEEIICAVLDEQLNISGDTDNRYKPYLYAVQANKHPAYVFAQKSGQLTVLEKKVTRLKIPYKRYTFNQFVVYQFARPLPPG